MLANPNLQMNLDEEEWIESNQEMIEPRVRELSIHYHGNKFRTTQRIVKPSLSSLALKDILVGFGLENMSFGVGKVPSTTIVSIVVGMNFSLDQTTFTTFSSHSLVLSQQSTSTTSRGIVNDITKTTVFEDVGRDLVMLSPMKTSNKDSAGKGHSEGRMSS